MTADKFKEGDELGCFVDRLLGRIWFTKNNALIGKPFSDKNLIDADFYPTIEMNLKGVEFQLFHPEIPIIEIPGCKDIIDKL